MIKLKLLLTGETIIVILLKEVQTKQSSLLELLATKCGFHKTLYIASSSVCTTEK